MVQQQISLKDVGNTNQHFNTNIQVIQPLLSKRIIPKINLHYEILPLLFN